MTWHTSIWYSNSCHTRVNMGASISPSFSKFLMPRTNSLVCRRVLCTKCTLHSNHRLTRVIFQHTKRLLHPERPFSHYINSHCLAAEMWTTMKNNLQGKQFLSCSFYLYRLRKYVSYSFPIINICNPRVHYETPCIIKCRFIIFHFTVFDPLFHLSFFLKSFNPQLFTRYRSKKHGSTVP